MEVVGVKSGVALSTVAPLAAIYHIIRNVGMIFPFAAVESCGARVHEREARPSWSESSLAGDVNA